MMRVRLSFSEDASSVERGQPQCEGEVLRYVRCIDGHKLLTDQVAVTVRGKQITFFRKTVHPLERDGAVHIKKGEVRPEYKDAVHLCLSYLVIDERVVPVWEVHRKGQVCLLDARSGDLLNATQK